MSRLSSMKDYKVKDSYVYDLNVEKNLKWVCRTDGTDAIGALTWEGIGLLTDMAERDMFKGWLKFKLAGTNQVYLMEQTRRG